MYFMFIDDNVLQTKVQLDFEYYKTIHTSSTVKDCLFFLKTHKKQTHKTNHCEHHQNIVAENMSRFSVEINLRFIFIWPSM